MATVAVIFSHGSVQGAINPLAYWHGPIDSRKGARTGYLYSHMQEGRRDSYEMS